MAVKYREIGWGTTNNYGIAKLDHNPDDTSKGTSPSYTGVGVGKLDIVARVSNPVTYTNIQSDPYELLDAYFIDDGVSATQTNYYNTNSSYLSVTFDNSGKKLENTHESSTQRLSAIPIGTTPSSTNTTKWDCDFMVEMDLVSYTGSSALQIGQGNDTISNTWGALECTGGEHIKFEVRGNIQNIYVDDVLKATTQIDFTKRQIYIRFSLNPSAVMKFRNLSIYAI